MAEGLIAMDIYKSELWLKDIDSVSANIPELSELKNKTVMITGAAGLVCSPIVYIFVRYNETHEETIQIAVAGRWFEEMEQRFGSLVYKDYFRFVTYDAASPVNKIDISADYIIHGASNASPDMIVKEPVETLMGNVLGLKNLFDYAKNHGTKRILYISSSEVYGQKQDDKPFTETEYGFIDILNPRSSYSVGKRAAETLCVSYSSEYGVESVMVRPGHIYGPTASPYDKRVSSAWAYSVARGEDIVMKSDGAQIRSYCYCLDCASAIIKVLMRGENCQAYNISNPNSIISIKDMAEMLVDSAGVQLKMELPTEDERKGFNPMSNSSLESHKLISLGWKGCFDAPIGFEHTVKILREMVK